MSVGNIEQPSNYKTLHMGPKKILEEIQKNSKQLDSIPLNMDASK